MGKLPGEQVEEEPPTWGKFSMHTHLGATAVGKEKVKMIGKDSKISSTIASDLPNSPNIKVLEVLH